MYSGKSTITFNAERKQNKGKGDGGGGGGGGGSTVPMLRSPATKFTEYLFNMHKPPVGHKSL